jgi:acyl-homoserine-lactone acylase
MSHSLPTWPRLALLAVLVPLLALLTPGGVVEAPSAAAAERLSAEIRRTAHGIPHITADDYAGMGYGYGYAIAEDNVCVLADTYVTVNAERSKYFGPDNSYVFEGNGVRANNLNSDFFFARIIERGTVEELLDAPYPTGPVDEIRDGVRGYVAGYNAYLREVGGADGISDPRCKGAEWVRPITEIDVYRRFYQLALLASGGVAIDGIGGAEPLLPLPGLPLDSLLGALPLDGLPELPGIGQLPAGAASTPEQLEALKAMATGEVDVREILGGIGSNGHAIGKAGTKTGQGMVLGNPHFPWQGSERFYQAHLTIPGKVDVAGGSLFGVPLVLIGHTENLAWTHTVSTAFRFVPIELTLLPGSPTTYLVDGQPRQMEADELTVEVRNGDGSIGTESRTLYTTEYGPMFTSILGLPLFPWTPLKAWAMYDVNAVNFRYLNHFFAKNHAQDVRELHDIFLEFQGVPWVNTMAADSNGETYYSDITAVPHVTDAQVQQCPTVLGVVTDQLIGLPILDGSRSSCAPGTDPDAVQPGMLGPSNLPHLFRDDFVVNANDSHWLSNPFEPLEGFPSIVGPERTERSLRTRLATLMPMERIAGTDDRGTAGFDFDDLLDMQYNNRVHGAEVVGDDLVAMCREQAMLPSGVDEAACDALEAWDRKANLDSEGTHLFREFMRLSAGPLPIGVGGFWLDSFDADDPVHTPRRLNTFSPTVRQGLEDAVSYFEDRGVALDAPFGTLQTEPRGDRRIPIHGSGGAEGATNVISAVRDDATGTYPRIRHGSSFIQAVAFNDTRCPDVRTILTYSQSTDPTSRWFGDQTELYSEKGWVTPPFCRDDVVRQTLETTEIAEVAGSTVVDRLSGAGRVETAVAVSRDRFTAARGGSIVLARADEYPDALAGAPLAADLDAPLLLTGRDGLHPATRQEIDRLGATRAVLLGGDAALSPQVVSDLRTAGVSSIERVAGANRFATAAEIARQLAATNPGRTAFLAEGQHADPGRGWPDALSAAPYAAHLGAPVLLATRDALPPETAAALRDLQVRETVIVGGEAAVGPAVATAVAAHGPRRLSGATRYATSAAVWAEATNRGMGAEEIWLATGRNFPDALAAGPAVAGAGASLLLVDGTHLSHSPPARETLAEAAPARVRLLGGDAAISNAVEAQVRLLLR